MVDRVVLRPDLEARLADSLETALALADAIAIAEDADTGERVIFSARFACPVSGFTIDEIEPRLFSFNNPFGACAACDGLGQELYFEADLVVPDPDKSLRKGAISPWAKSTSPYYLQTLDSLARYYKVPMTKPWRELPESFRDAVLFGSGDEPITMRYDDGLRTYKTRQPFEGVIPNLRRRWQETDSVWLREELERFQGVTHCASSSHFGSSG